MATSLTSAAVPGAAWPGFVWPGEPLESAEPPALVFFTVMTGRTLWRVTGAQNA